MPNRLKIDKQHVKFFLLARTDIFGFDFFEGIFVSEISDIYIQVQ